MSSEEKRIVITKTPVDRVNEADKDDPVYCEEHEFLYKNLNSFKQHWYTLHRGQKMNLHKQITREVKTPSATNSSSSNTITVPQLPPQLATTTTTKPLPQPASTTPKLPAQPTTNQKSVGKKSEREQRTEEFSKVIKSMCNNEEGEFAKKFYDMVAEEMVDHVIIRCRTVSILQDYDKVVAQTTNMNGELAQGDIDFACKILDNCKSVVESSNEMLSTNASRYSIQINRVKEVEFQIANTIGKWYASNHTKRKISCDETLDEVDNNETVKDDDGFVVPQQKFKIKKTQ